MRKQIALYLDEEDIQNLKIAAATKNIQQLKLLEIIIREWLEKADLSTKDAF